MDLKYKLDNAHHQDSLLYNLHHYKISHHHIIALSNEDIHTSTIHHHINITSPCFSHQHLSLTSIEQHHFIKPIYFLNDLPLMLT